MIDVTVAGLSVPNSPLIAKAYDASLIKVTDIGDGVVADLSTFRGMVALWDISHFYDLRRANIEN